MMREMRDAREVCGPIFYDMFLGSSNKYRLNCFRLSRVQLREKRIAPGLVLPEYQIEPNTEVRDLLATAAFDTQRSWSWIKDYRRTMLGGARY